MDILADNEKVLQRLLICEQCEHRNEGFCELCGCLLFVKAKLEKTKCPDDKW